MRQNLVKLSFPGELCFFKRQLFQLHHPLKILHIYFLLLNQVLVEQLSVLCNFLQIDNFRRDFQLEHQILLLDHVVIVKKAVRLF
jgi:hypothetical protein